MMRVSLKLCSVAAAGAAAPPRHRRELTLLHHLPAALPPHRAAAEPRGDLVDGEHKKVDEATWAAAAHGGALGGGPAGDLGEPRVTAGRE